MKVREQEHDKEMELYDEGEGVAVWLVTAIQTMSE